MRSISLIACAIIIINLVSCSKEFNSNNLEDNATHRVKEVSTQDYLFEGQTAEEVRLEISGREVILQKFGNQYLLGGDVVLSEREVQNIKEENLKKGGGVKSSRRWPNSVAYYQLDKSNLSSAQISRIRKSVEEISNKTNFTLIERFNEPDYIEISSANHNTSYGIGKSLEGGKQRIVITPTASVGVIQHEFMHAMGIYHEQTRIDRDSYVNIYWNNILSDKTHNFEKYESYEGTDFGSFDYNSLMIYSLH